MLVCVGSAEVVEMADTRCSGRRRRTPVRVQIPSSAPFNLRPNYAQNFTQNGMTPEVGAIIRNPGSLDRNGHLSESTAPIWPVSGLNR